MGVAWVIVGGAILGAFAGFGEGLGVDLCWFHRLTALPCPGCGLTRAVIGLLRGDAVEAIRLNPFSLVVLPYALLTASSIAWPTTLEAGVRRILERHRRRFDWCYGALIALFVLHGLVRTTAVGIGVLSWAP